LDIYKCPFLRKADTALQKGPKNRGVTEML